MPHVILNGVKTGFDALPADTYEAIFSGHKNKKNRNGDDMITAEFTIVGGEFDGRKAWNNYNMTPEGYRFFKLFLMAIDAPEDVLEGEFDSDEVLGALKGASVNLIVGEPRIDDREQERTNIKQVLPPG